MVFFWPKKQLGYNVLVIFKEGGIMTKKKFIPYFLDLFALSFPIIFGNIGQIFIGATEIYVSGKHSSLTLAAIGLSQGVTAPFLMIGVGFLFGLSTLLAHKKGEGENPESYFRSSLLYGLVTSLVVIPSLWLFLFFIPYIGFDDRLVGPIADYGFLFSFSLLPTFLYQSVREYLQAMEKVFLANLLSFLGALLNLVMGFIFVFGYGPFPEMGLQGLGISINIVRWLTFLAIFLPCVPLLKKSFSIDIPFLKETMRLSFPLSITTFLEVCSFCLVTILTGVMGVIEAAAHNVVFTLVSLTFMVPMGISHATCVKVSSALGSKNFERAFVYSWVGIFMATGVMLVSAFCFYFIKWPLFSFFSKDKTIFAMATSIFTVAAILQLVDGLQVALNSVLRAFKMTKECMKVTLISHWVIGIPVGCYLGFYQKWGPVGLWVGLLIALFMVSFLLLLLFLRKGRELSHTPLNGV